MNIKEIELEIDTLKEQKADLEAKLPRAKKFDMAAMWVDVGSVVPFCLGLFVPGFNIFAGVGIAVAMVIGSKVIAKVGGKEKKISAKIKALDKNIEKLEVQKADLEKQAQLTTETEKVETSEVAQEAANEKQAEAETAPEVSTNEVEEKEEQKEEVLEEAKAEDEVSMEI